MHMVGIKDLKDKLTYYLKITREGDQVIVTDRGTPVAVLHGLDQIENGAGLVEKLASLAKRGMIRLPRKKGKFTLFSSLAVKGKPASESITEERR